MFTGIIESTGTIKEVINSGGNITLWISSTISNELKVDQSLSHNGVCLTIEEVMNGMHRVTAIGETLLKTNIGKWGNGDLVNLERCMPINGRIDGHIVQGHVDTVAECIEIREKDGSREYRFSIPDEFSTLIIEKGAVSLNGISLTVFNVSGNSFTVAIIPYTNDHTNISMLKKGDTVNIEFDVIGKYVNRIYSNRINQAGN